MLVEVPILISSELKKLVPWLAKFQVFIDLGCSPSLLFCNIGPLPVWLNDINTTFLFLCVNVFFMYNVFFIIFCLHIAMVDSLNSKTEAWEKDKGIEFTYDGVSTF